MSGVWPNLIDFIARCAASPRASAESGVTSLQALDGVDKDLELASALTNYCVIALLHAPVDVNGALVSFSPEAGAVC